MMWTFGATALPWLALSARRVSTVSTVTIELKLPGPGSGAGVKPATGGGGLPPACLIHHLHVTPASVIYIRK